MHVLPHNTRYFEEGNSGDKSKTIKTKVKKGEVKNSLIFETIKWGGGESHSTHSNSRKISPRRDTVHSSQPKGHRETSKGPEYLPGPCKSI